MSSGEPITLSEGRGTLPERIGGFKIRAVLGHGSMGVVLDAIAPDGKPVALKILRAPSDPDRAPVLIARFLRESKILSRIEHPSIVRLIDAGEADGQLYLAMERLNGTSLHEVRKRGPLELPALLAIGRDLAGALAFLHELGVVHRDLKPANILLDDRGRAVIADFGISRDEDATGVTQQGDVLGSPGFIAPELLDGEEATPLSDQFALGRVLFELGAMGGVWTLPRGLSVMEMLEAGRKIDWGRWRSGPGWSAFGAIVRRMLSERPLDRFSSTGAAREAIAILEGAPTPLPQDTLRDLEDVFDASELELLQPVHLETARASAATPVIFEDLEVPASGSRPPELRLSLSPLAQQEGLEIAKPLSQILAEREAAGGPDGDAWAGTFEVPATEKRSLPLPEEPPLEAADPRPSQAPRSERQDRQLAALREQLAAERRDSRASRLKLALVAALLALPIGATIGFFLPRGPEPAPQVVLAPVALEALGEPKAAYKGTAAAPSAQDRSDAVNLLATARDALAQRSFESAERSLKLCIEIADLPECHKTLAGWLSLIGDPAARTHLEHYLRIAPAAGDAPALRQALEGYPAKER